MARFFKKREEIRGLSPGSMVFIGEQKVDTVRIRLIDYDGSQLTEDELKDIAGGAEFRRTSTVTWINVDGFHDLSLMKQIGDSFELHPLLVEDILNTGQLPKLEEFDNCLFVVLKMLRYDRSGKMIVSEQLSMVLGESYLLTIFAAVFIPLTFIAGIYGSNFEYLPELKFKYSYFIFWGVMIGVAVGMIIYFKRKRWL